MARGVEWSCPVFVGYVDGSRVQGAHGQESRDVVRVARAPRLLPRGVRPVFCRRRFTHDLGQGLLVGWLAGWLVLVVAVARAEANRNRKPQTISDLLDMLAAGGEL